MREYFFTLIWQYCFEWCYCYGENPPNFRPPMLRLDSKQRSKKTTTNRKEFVCFYLQSTPWVKHCDKVFNVYICVSGRRECWRGCAISSISGISQRIIYYLASHVRRGKGCACRRTCGLKKKIAELNLRISFICAGVQNI